MKRALSWRKGPKDSERVPVTVAVQRAVEAPFDLGDYRSEILRVGRLIGWTEADVIRFAQTVTGVRWEDCQADELDRVVTAFGELATRVRTRMAVHVN